MTGNLNKVTLIGNVGAKPEIKTLKENKKLATFKLATSEFWTDKDSGEKKKKTEWHRIVIYNENLVKIVESYVNKGSRIYIEGALYTNEWQDQTGAKRYTTEIILQSFDSKLMMLDGKKIESVESVEKQLESA